jgi:hypothetical protein
MTQGRKKILPKGLSWQVNSGYRSMINQIFPQLKRILPEFVLYKKTKGDKVRKYFFIFCHNFFLQERKGRIFEYDGVYEDIVSIIWQMWNPL